MDPSIFLDPFIGKDPAVIIAVTLLYDLYSISDSSEMLESTQDSHENLESTQDSGGGGGSVASFIGSVFVSFPGRVPAFSNTVRVDEDHRVARKICESIAVTRDVISACALAQDLLDSTILRCM
jgi:hypothetical protein